MFLGGKFGTFQLIRGASQQIQPHLTLPLIRSLYVPNIVVEKAVKLYEEALEEFNISKSLYSQAEDLLLEELGLKDFKPPEDLFYIVNLSDLKSAHRADSEYFQPKYKRFISKIKNTKKLLDFVDNILPRFDPINQPDKIFKYVELADIDSSIGIIDRYSEVFGYEAPSRAKRLLKTGDVIISSVQGSLGKVALVNREQDGFLASTGFFQFRSSKELLPEVLLVLAKSPILQMQLEKQCAGTILTAIPKEGVKDILVPNLGNSIQQKIADLVQQSHQARKKSKELLEKAKREVEELIEGKNIEK